MQRMVPLWAFWHVNLATLTDSTQDALFLCFWLGTANEQGLLSGELEGKKEAVVIL